MTSGFIVRLQAHRVRGGLALPRARAIVWIACSTATRCIRRLTIAADNLASCRSGLAATAEASRTGSSRFGSAFPFVGRTLLAPAPTACLASASCRARCAGKPRDSCRCNSCHDCSPMRSLKEERWAVDPVSECCAPGRKIRRSNSAVPHRDAKQPRLWIVCLT